ncbi:hypothetical protein GmHk_17G049799 [Glycine max]|nr:hypothetical protein GmHk_17G049799 [Glycine max]
MASPPALPPPHPPAPPAPPPHPFDTSASPSAVKRTQKASCLQSLSTRSIDAERPVVHIDPATGKADEFEISEASDSRTKKKLLQTVGEKWRQFKSDLTKKWALAADQDGVDDTVCEKYGISKEKWAQFCQTCRDPSWEKLLAEKTKKKLEEATQSGSVDGVIDPPSPVRRHMKIPLRSRRHRDPSSPMDVRMFSPLLLDVQSTLDVSVLLEPVSPSSNTSDWLHGSHDIVQPDAVPVSVLDAISETSTAFGASDRCGLYIEANPARLVAQGRVYERSTIIHKTPLLPGQVKVGVEEVKDPDVAVPVPTDEVLYSYYMFLLFQLIHSACLKLGHLTLFHEQPVVSPAKPPQKPDPEVDDPLYLMTLTIPVLFLRPYQVTWDATVFGVFNLDFPLYIKHEDLSEIAHSGQCLSILVL